MIYVKNKAVAELKLASDEGVTSISISRSNAKGEFYVMIHLSSEVVVYAIPEIQDDAFIGLDAVLRINVPEYLESGTEALMSFVQRNSSIHIFGAWKGDLIAHRYDLPVSTSTLLCSNNSVQDEDKEEEKEDKKKKKKKSKKKKKAKDDEKKKNEEEEESRIAILQRCKDLICESTLLLASRISSVSVNTSGTLCAVGCENGTISVWRDMCPVDVFISNRCHGGVEISAVSICCDEYVVTGAKDGSICVHHLKSKRMVIARDGDGSEITSLTSVSKIPLTIVGNKAGEMYVLEVDSGDIVGSLVLNSKDSIDLCVEDENVLFVASRKSGVAALYPVLDLLRELFPSVGRNVESKIDIAKRYYVQSKPSQRRKEHDVRIKCVEKDTPSSSLVAIQDLTSRLSRRDSSRKNNTVLVAEEEKEEKSDVVVLRSHDSSRESKNSFRDPRSMAFAFRSLRNTNDSTLRLSKQRGDLLSMLKKRRRSNNK